MYLIVVTVISTKNEYIYIYIYIYIYTYIYIYQNTFAMNCLDFFFCNRTKMNKKYVTKTIKLE